MSSPNFSTASHGSLARRRVVGAFTETPDEIDAFDRADTFAGFAPSSGGSWLNKATPMTGAARLEFTALRDGSAAPVRIVVTADLRRRADCLQAAALDAIYQLVAVAATGAFPSAFSLAFPEIGGDHDDGPHHVSAIV